MSSLCDYSESYALVKGTITVPNTGAAAAPNKRNKKVIFKNCAPFTDCISEIKNTQVNNAKDTDVVMTMYDLIEYTNNCLKTPGSVWQYYRDELVLNNASGITDFPDANNNSVSFNFKHKITVQTGNDGTKNVQIMMPLKYLSNFWGTLETP